MVVEFPSIDTIPGLRLLNSHLDLNSATAAGTPNFDAAKRLLENNKTMYSGAAAYSFDTGGLPAE